MLMTLNKIVNNTISQKQADEVRWTEGKTGIRNQVNKAIITVLRQEKNTLK